MPTNILAPHRDVASAYKKKESPAAQPRFGPLLHSAGPKASKLCPNFSLPSMGHSPKLADYLTIIEQLKTDLMNKYLIFILIC